MRRNARDDEFEDDFAASGVDFDPHAPTTAELLAKAEAILRREGSISWREQEVQRAEERLLEERREAYRRAPHPQADGLSNGEVDSIMDARGTREMFQPFSQVHRKVKPLEVVEGDEQLRLLTQAIRGEVIRHFGIGEGTDAANGGRELLRQWVHSKIGVISSDLILSLVGIQKDSWSKYEVKAYGDSNPTMRDLQALAREEMLTILRPQVRAVLKEKEKEIVDLYRQHFASELRKQVQEQAAANARSYAQKMLSEVGERLAEDAIMSLFPFIKRIKALQQLGKEPEKLNEAP